MAEQKEQKIQAVQAEQKVQKEQKKKKKIWPIILIAGIVALVIAILFFIVFFIAAILLFNKADESNNHFNYSYADLMADTDMSKRPETVITASGEPYDYTFVNDAVTQDAFSVEAWINKYYPGSSIQKTKSNVGEIWTITSPNTMNPVSINGVLIYYDEIEFNIMDGYAQKVTFVQNGGGEAELNDLHKAFQFKYTYAAPQENKGNAISKLTDPTYESTSYWWFSNEFDGFYNLILEREVANSQSKIKVSIQRY